MVAQRGAGLVAADRKAEGAVLREAIKGTAAAVGQALQGQGASGRRGVVYLEADGVADGGVARLIGGSGAKLVSAVRQARLAGGGACPGGAAIG